MTGVDPSVFRRYFREEEEEDLGESEEGMEISAGGYNRYTVHQYREISAGGYNSYTVHQYKYTPLLCFSLKMQLTLYSIQYSNLSE